VRSVYQGFWPTWRKEARRIWSSPPNTRCNLLYGIAGCILIFSELCCHMYVFFVFLFAQRLAFYSFCTVAWPTLSPVAHNAIFILLCWHMKFNTTAEHKLFTGQLKIRFASRLLSSSPGNIRCLSKSLPISHGILLLS
jgi:hypothetical protein